MEADELLPHLPSPWPPKEAEKIKSLARALRNSINAFAEEEFDLIVDGILPYGNNKGIIESLNLFSRHRNIRKGLGQAYSQKIKSAIMQNLPSFDFSPN